MKTIESLLRDKKKIYVHLKDKKTALNFLRQAENEGFTFGDGVPPTKRKPDDYYAVMADKTLCFVGFAGRMKIQSGTEYAEWSEKEVTFVRRNGIHSSEYDNNIAYLLKGRISDMELKGSKTEANLLAAFSGESQARNKYTFFASKAKRDGYEQIASIFEETANNERAHAKLWWTILTGGAGTTKENLINAAAGENYEWTQMYRDFAAEAREEGFFHIGELFELVGKIEQEHEERFRKLIENIEEGLVFSRETDKVWLCRNCGHLHFGKDAPEVCPVCAHPQAFFEIRCENY